MTTNNATLILLAERTTTRPHDAHTAADAVRPTTPRLRRALSATLDEFRRQLRLPRVSPTGVDPVEFGSS